MTFELSEIKQIRKQLILTQSQLAKAAGVSQSLIAKVEANRLDPTFTKAKKIFEALQHFQGKKELKAKDIMNGKVFSVSPDTTIKETINVMKKHAISQMPVMQSEQVIGFISEAIILDALLEHRGNHVKDIMRDVPPIIGRNTSIEVITDLLKFYQLVVVAENGRVEGIITRADVLKRM